MELYRNATWDMDMSYVPGFISRFEHYKRWVTEIWGQEDSIWPFEWNPNAERIIELKMSEKILMVAGCASSGKTEAICVWGITNFLLDPFATKVLVTSVSLKSSRGKIWGSISECWQQAGMAIAKSYGADITNWEQWLPGKLLQQGIIKYSLEGTETEKAGLELIAGDVSKAKDSAAKVQGYKRDRLIGILDEVATLDHGLVNTFNSNIRANPNADITGAFNPECHFDPAGKMCEPENGWSSVDLDSMEWRAKGGAYVLRLDGHKSPNVVAGYAKFRGLLREEELEDAKIKWGENSKQYYQMYRGFWSPTGSLDCIYSEGEILAWQCDHKVDKEWIQPPTPCAFLDPSFSHGGDRAMAIYGQLGLARINGVTKKVLNIKEIEQLDRGIFESEDKPTRLAHIYKDWCIARNISPEHAGVDSTGSQFYSILSAIWSPRVLQVNFGAGPSDKPVTKSEGPAKNHYAKKVDELWWAPKSLMRMGQIKGMTAELIVELTSRTSGKDTQQRDKIKVESKEKMKERTLRSPDLGDAFCGLVDVARFRMGFVTLERPKRDLVNGKSRVVKQAYEKSISALSEGLTYSGESSIFWQ